MVVTVQGLAGMAFGQERFSFEIGPYVARDDWRARDFQIGPPQALPPINSRLRYDDHNGYGIRFNLLSQGYWGGELAYSYQKNTVTLSRQGFAPAALRGGVHHFFYNTLLYPVRYRNTGVMPFVTAGIGLAGYRLGDAARAGAAAVGLGQLASLDKRVAFNYGAGVKANVTSALGIRVDVRHIFSDVPSYGLPKGSPNRNQMVLPIQGKLQTVEGSAGIYFHFLK